MGNRLLFISNKADKNKFKKGMNKYPENNFKNYNEENKSPPPANQQRESYKDRLSV